MSRQEIILEHGKRFALGAAALVNVMVAILLSLSGYAGEVLLGAAIIYGTAISYLAGTAIMELWNRRAA